MSALPLALPARLTRTAYRVDLYLGGDWQPQVYLPTAEIARRQLDTFARSLRDAHQTTPVAAPDGLSYSWPGGGIRAVRCVVED